LLLCAGDNAAVKNITMAAKAAKPIYVIHGPDGFLRDAHRREIVAHLIGRADPQLCVSTFDADAELADVLDELRTVPFLAPRRVVIVRNADAFVSAHRSQLEKYLQSPAQTASLILIVLSWKANTRLYKTVQRIGEALDCSAPQRGLDRWLAQAAAKRNKKLAPDAAELLAEWVGNDLATMDAELEKLSLYVGERSGITVEDVSALVAATAGPGAFALTNAIIDGQTTAALEALGGMVNSRGDEFRTLSLIGGHLRRALRGAELAAAGKPPESALNPRTPPQRKRAFAAMVRQRGLAGIRRDFRRMIRADLAMKSGARPMAALQELVVALCWRQSGASPRAARP